jgi:hypothetical protein
MEQAAVVVAVDQRQIILMVKLVAMAEATVAVVVDLAIQLAAL